MKLIEINISRKDNYIRFESDNFLKLNDLVYLYGQKKYYYSVININIKPNNIYIITAKPAGYYNKLEKESEDIRYLFNSPIIRELDPEIIKKIREESCYL